MERSSDPALDEDEALSGPLLRSLLLKIVLGIAVLMTVLVVLGRIYRAPLVALSQDFVTTFGGPGLALTFLVPDATALPIPQDAVAALGLVGGMRFWSVVAWCSLGSLSGGTIGFFIGIWLSKSTTFERLMREKGKTVRALVKRYGGWGLAIAALSPLPYSVGCWASGAFGMSLGRFWAVSLLRIPRIIFYLWLISIGVLEVFGGME